MLQHKCKDVGVNMKDKELVKMFNLTLKRKDTILFFLIVVINRLTWIVSNIELDMCVKGGEGWRYQKWKWIKKKKIERFLTMKGVLSSGVLDLNILCKGCSSHTTLIGLYCILRETSQRKSASVIKFSQPRAWISSKRASAAPQSK